MSDEDFFASMNSRRAFMLGAACAGMGFSGEFHAALAAVDPKVMQKTIAPDMAPGWRPTDKDEKGLWYQVEKVEQDVKNSEFLLRDEKLNLYIRNLVCDLAGEYCPDTRVYILRTPYFNASMYPNGMMQVWTGLLLRMKSEAQLCAVLGHEMGHYLRRHSIKQWRSVRSKTSIYSFLALPLAIATMGAGNMLAELALIASIYGYSREFEREADTYGVQLLEAHNYDPREASKVWAQLIKERDEKFKARGRKKPAEPILFATHPAPQDRMEDLAKMADAMAAGKTYAGGKKPDGSDKFIEVIRPWRGQFMNDQVKLNDFGGTMFLIDSLMGEGWDGELNYYRGETYRLRAATGDMQKAIAAYQAALKLPDAPAETWRSLGFAQIKMGESEAGKTALRKYLELKPNAVDRAMVEFNLQ